MCFIVVCECPRFKKNTVDPLLVYLDWIKYGYSADTKLGVVCALFWLRKEFP
jgi:hypothetical protein